MTVWISEINRQANVGEEENKFLTLPPNPTINKSEPKKRSRFSFRKQKGLDAIQMIILNFTSLVTVSSNSFFDLD